MRFRRYFCLFPALLAAAGCADTAAPEAASVSAVMWTQDTLYVADHARITQHSIRVRSASGITTVTSFTTVGAHRCEATSTAEAWLCDVVISPTQAPRDVAIDSIRIVSGGAMTIIRPQAQPLGVLLHPRLASCVEITLSAGEAAHVQRNDCYRVTQPGLYIVTYFDGRYIASVRSGGPDAQSASTEHVYFRVGSPFTSDDGSANAPFMTSRELPHVLRTPDTEVAEYCGREPTDLFCHYTHRLTVGDQAQGALRVEEAPTTLRVVSVREPLVIAVPVEDLAHWTASWATALEEALDEIFRHGFPLFQATLSPTIPRTSSQSEQLVAVFRTKPGSFARQLAGTGWARAYVVMGLHAYGPAPNPDVLKETFLHELVHAWQVQFRGDTRALPNLFWAVEGTASLLSAEGLRRMIGAPFDGNATPAQLEQSATAESYVRLLTSGMGRLGRGYSDTAAFLRAQVARCVAANHTLDFCFAAVTQGSLEGWLGTFNGFRYGPGLAGRMTAALGEPWMPEHAVGEWLLATAFDDRVAHARWQLPYIYQAGAHTQLTPAGSYSTSIRVPVQLSLYVGSAGYVELNTAANGYVALDSNSPNPVWSIARVH